MGVVAKRSSMTFYSDGIDHYSHRVRIVLAEKGVAVDVVAVDPSSKPEDLADLNPYNELPTLVDRELVLYQTEVMMEYLDERFPHPPLLPVYPVARAQSRLLIYRIERDWGENIRNALRLDDSAKCAKGKKELRESLIGIAPIFDELPYFMSEEFTLVDCCIAPILWRLPLLGIELPPKQCAALLAYAERLFKRDSFQASLSPFEAEIRKRAMQF